VIGQRTEGGYCGHPVPQWTKPETDFPCEPFAPQASDDFSGPELSPQWQWNHNPVDEKWSLTERRGWLRLKSSFVNGDITATPNILTQKLMGACGNISVILSTKNMADSQVAGLMLFGTESLYIAAVKMPDRLCIDTPHVGSRKRDLPMVQAEEILLRVTVQYLAQPVFSYSLDGGKTFAYFPAGPLTKGVWKGTRVALFTRDGMGGSADFKNFTYIHDGPKGCCP